MFLREYVYPEIRYQSIIHDSYHCHNRNISGEPWPSKRVGDCFVGSRKNCNINAKKFFECPKKCRKNRSWVYC